MYWAVEKGNATMVRDILQCNPDTEICTKVPATLLLCQQCCMLAVVTVVGVRVIPVSLVMFHTCA